MTWKPIDTAPRTGQVIRARDSDGNDFRCRWWSKSDLRNYDSEDFGWYEAAAGSDDEEGDWVEPVIWLDEIEDVVCLSGHGKIVNERIKG